MIPVTPSPVHEYNNRNTNEPLPGVVSKPPAPQRPVALPPAAGGRPSGQPGKPTVGGAFNNSTEIRGTQSMGIYEWTEEVYTNWSVTMTTWTMIVLIQMGVYI